jgi:hypothetical protein
MKLVWFAAGAAIGSAGTWVLTTIRAIRREEGTLSPPEHHR